MNLKHFLASSITQWIITGGLASAVTLVTGAMVRNLPQPLPMGSRFYAWFYNTVHSLFSNPDLKKPAQT